MIVCVSRRERDNRVRKRISMIWAEVYKTMHMCMIVGEVYAGSRRISLALA